ncbi:MAG: shikimate dehydrogenase [Defluviitaleaceae bacterium]|nr:shikimate dehydrogenase [Defluviitaleaceae bacterium]
MISQNSQINGKTAAFGVIGNPISHTLSPQIHAHFAQLYNINMAYLPFCVQEEQLQSAINGAFALGIRGLNITVPHKIAVIPHLLAVDKMATRVGAVNTLVSSENDENNEKVKKTKNFEQFEQKVEKVELEKNSKLAEKSQKKEKTAPNERNILNTPKNGYIGYNTDYIGIIRTIENTQQSAQNAATFENSHVAIIGAGGSAYAAAIAAAEKSAKKLTVVNRTTENAIALAKHVKKYYNISIDLFTPQDFNNIAQNPPNYDIIIQTTTVGFANGVNGSLVSNLAIFGNTKLAFDLIYSPWQTQFLQDAKFAGVPNVVNGFPMLVHQAFAAFQLWHNVNPQAHDLEEQIEKLSKRLYAD